MYFRFPTQKASAIAALAPGESLIFGVNDSTLQLVQSGIHSTLKKRDLPSGGFTSRKGLLVLDEHTKPQVVVVLTRLAAAE
ncbi:hypothetical protein [Achromobacter insuavis]|uniref:hypothetical protein n=1 Tax=Achromobacter insuavis TaxID=1287735 RepID=UPI001F12A5B6|nr:hypothetical protein [Achromobacter insuavis]